MIALLVFVALLVIGLPIAPTLLLTAFTLIASQGAWVLLESIPHQLLAGLDNYGLLALPLFILLGEVMAASGSGRRLINLAAALTGPIRGGLAYVTLIANAVLAAILGSTVAQLTVMTRLVVPQMEAQGYEKNEAVALTAAGALLAPIIPPSMMFIIYGMIAQVSIGDLFIAGIIPGLAITLAFGILIAIMARKRNWPRGAPRKASVIGAALREALPSVSIPLVVVGSIASGLASPVEAAALATALAILIGMIVHRELPLSALPALLARAASGTAMVLFLVASAQVLAWVLAWSGAPAQIASWLAELSSSPLMFLILLNLVLLAIGMVMDPIPALILTVPVLLPVATDHFGLDPLHMGLIFCINLSIGLFTPPVGSGLFAAATLSGAPALSIARALLPWLGAALLVLAALSVWPLLV